MKASELNVGEEYAVKSGDIKFSWIREGQRVRILEAPVHGWLRKRRYSYNYVSNDVDTRGPKNSALVLLLDPETGSVLTDTETGNGRTDRVLLRDIKITWDGFEEGVVARQDRDKAMQEYRVAEDARKDENEKLIAEANEMLALHGLSLYMGSGYGGYHLELRLVDTNKLTKQQQISKIVEKLGVMEIEI